MRIWDLSPGYLNRDSLLGEHRELHGLYSILVNGKQGYSRHPETLRWAEAVGGLGWRHRELALEQGEDYLLHSTALSELEPFVVVPPV